MSQFLTMPRELRDKILLLVLYACRPTPATLEEVEEQQRKTLHGNGSDESIYYGSSSFYTLTDAAYYALNGPPLLLCNKQLYQETKAVIDRHGLNYELDIKIVNDQYIAPTWKSIPFHAERLNQVNVVFQSIGICKSPAQPTVSIVPFYDLLRQFLCKGPVGLQRLHSKPKTMTVDRLELDCIDPDQLNSVPVSKQHPGGDWSMTSFEPILREKVKYTLGIPYFLRSYGVIFYERFGSIAFKVNGQLVEEIDLSRTLADLTFDDSLIDLDPDLMLDNNSLDLEVKVWTPDEWIKWKEGMLQIRKHRGFSAVEFNLGWKEDAVESAKKIYEDRPDILESLGLLQ